MKRNKDDSIKCLSEYFIVWPIEVEGSSGKNGADKKHRNKEVETRKNKAGRQG